MEELKAKTTMRMLTMTKMKDLGPAVTSMEDFALTVEDLGLKVMDRVGVDLASPRMMGTMKSKMMGMTTVNNVAVSGHVAVEVVHVVEAEEVDLVVAVDAEEVKMEMTRRKMMVEVSRS